MTLKLAKYGSDIPAFKATYQHIGVDRHKEIDDAVRELQDGQKKKKEYKIKGTMQ